MLMNVHVELAIWHLNMCWKNVWHLQNRENYFNSAVFHFKKSKQKLHIIQLPLVGIILTLTCSF